VSEADPVGGYPFLSVDLVGAEADLVNKENDLLYTYMFVAFVVIINKRPAEA
jgi:hypothetical protein